MLVCEDAPRFRTDPTKHGAVWPLGVWPTLTESANRVFEGEHILFPRHGGPTEHFRRALGLSLRERQHMDNQPVQRRTRHRSTNRLHLNFTEAISQLVSRMTDHLSGGETAP